MSSIAAQKVRSAAHSQWGPVNSCRQVIPGVWEVDTWGHGGYLVAVPDFPLDFALRIDKFLGDAWTRGGMPIVEFFAFEEDCDWAVLMHYHPAIADAVVRKAGPEYADQYAPARVREVVERWNPELVKKEAA